MRQRFDNLRMGNQRGAVAITVAAMMVMLVGFAALAIDVGYLMATRNELQNVADSAALAAARKMGNNYQNMSYSEQLSYDCSSNGLYPCSQIVTVAREVGLLNQAARTNIVIDNADIEIGTWTVGADPPFILTTVHPNAVRVMARRDDNSNNPITTFLAGVLGVDSFAVTAQATAALTGQSSVEEGELELPVGISKAWFTNNLCGQPIRFSPTNSTDSCAGWTSWEYNSNDANIRKILDLENPLLSPDLDTGDMIEFIGGDLSNPTFDALETLFQHKGFDVLDYVKPEEAQPIPELGDPVPICEKNAGDTESFYPCDTTHTVPLLYPDGSPRNLHIWRTRVAVYDRDDCSNPNQSIAILGFANVTITEVLNAPDKSIVGVVDCEVNDKGLSRGGGGSYGTYGSIPGLVQ
ncbi:MAG: pilus assembly protein TadG-related protein [Desulfuromonadales bacterium]|nr:pilus assembly protein TadG-related protein [Desulfuromonadales bacterium]